MAAYEMRQWMLQLFHAFQTFHCQRLPEGLLIEPSERAKLAAQAVRGRALWGLWGLRWVRWVLGLGFVGLVWFWFIANFSGTTVARPGADQRSCWSLMIWRSELKQADPHEIKIAAAKTERWFMHRGSFTLALHHLFGKLGKLTATRCGSGHQKSSP